MLQQKYATIQQLQEDLDALPDEGHIGPPDKTQLPKRTAPISASHTPMGVDLHLDPVSDDHPLATTYAELVAKVLFIQAHLAESIEFRVQQPEPAPPEQPHPIPLAEIAPQSTHDATDTTMSEEECDIFLSSRGQQIPLDADVSTKRVLVREILDHETFQTKRRRNDDGT